MLTMNSLGNHQSLIEELSVVTATRLAEARPILRGDDLKAAVHEARRIAKEQRAILRAIQPATGPAHARHNLRLRDAAHRLSSARDAAALIDAVDEQLVAHARSPDEVAVIAAVRAWLVGRLASIDMADLRRDTRLLVAELEATPPLMLELELDRPQAAALAAGVARTYRRGRRAMRHARSRDDAESWHEWRKRAKDHRYQLELLLDMRPRTLASRHDACKRLTQALGGDHDLIVLEAALAADTPLDATGDALVLELIARTRVELRRVAAALGTQVYAQSPRKLTRDVARRWIRHTGSGRR